jgi:hypothetical protein
MYEEHPFFGPPSGSLVLWRYMDFVKFVSLLDEKALYFSRSDHLGDPFEGSLSVPSVALRGLHIDGLSLTADEKVDLAKQTSKVFRTTRYLTYINCWHIDEEESVAMWQIYAPGNGVAIKSTTDRLTKSFPSSDPVKVNLGTVRYEHEKAIAAGSLLFLPYLVKRRSFAYERELRGVIQDTSRLDEGGDVLAASMPLGKLVSVDVTTLIESIHVSPAAADWFLELVQSVAARFGCEAPVTRSSLAGDPVY